MYPLVAMAVPADLPPAAVMAHGLIETFHFLVLAVCSAASLG